MTVNKILVEDMGCGVFVDKVTNDTYVWDLEDGVLGYLENQATLEKLNVVDDFRDEDDNVEFFLVECK